VTALLATHRLQDGFALANFHFDPETKRVVPNGTMETPRELLTRHGRDFWFTVTGEFILKASRKKFKHGRCLSEAFSGVNLE